MGAQFSQDPLFEAALDAMPEALSSGLRAAGLADLGLLDACPRDSFEELVAARVTGNESGERVDMNAGLVTAGVVGPGGGPGNTTVDTGMDVDEGYTYSCSTVIHRCGLARGVVFHVVFRLRNEDPVIS